MSPREFRQPCLPRIFSLASLLLLTVVSTCPAESVTVGFVAIVDGIDDMFCQCISEDEVAMGDTLRGYYTYDTGAVDTNPDPHKGVYHYATLPNGIHVYHRNYTFASDPNQVNLWISVYDSVDVGPVVDEFWARSHGNMPDPIYAGTLAMILVDFMDPSATALSSDALPTGPPDLMAYSSPSVGVYGDSFDWAIYGEIISVTSGPATSVGQRPAPALRLVNSPNPFSRETTIRYALPEGERATLRVFDVAGRMVRTLQVPSPARAGAARWDGRDDSGREVPSGVYFLQLRGSTVTSTRKMLLVR